MQMKRMKCALSCILCTVLIVAMALITAACGDKADQPASETVTITDGDVLGDGEVRFDFTVVDQEGKSVTCEICTDKKLVGEALQELGLLAGEEGPYGLYVKTVNGITVDYDKDGKYWAFYVDDAYASSGVDATEIRAGESYAFKVE